MNQNGNSGVTSSVLPRKQVRPVSFHAGCRVGLIMLGYFILSIVFGNIVVYLYGFYYKMLGVVRAFFENPSRFNFIRAYEQTQPRLDEVGTYVIFLLSYLVPLVLLIAISSASCKMRLARFVPSQKTHPMDFLLAVMMCLAASIIGNQINVAIISALDLAGIYNQSSGFGMPSHPVAVALYVVTVVVLPPILEEFLCRGVILRELSSAGAGIAVFVSAISFSLMHANISQFASALIFGMAAA